MDWNDDAIVLMARKHGETSTIVSLLTSAHGRHAGLVRGGAGRRARGIYQPGNLVRASWRARLPEHLGTYTCELTRAHAADYLLDRRKLAALSAVTAMTEASLPEREPHAAVYDSTAGLLDALAGPGWEAIYVRWELALLTELGFGLDLTECAATGTSDDLVYVSPKSGRAVSAAAGAPYHERMLKLPAFLLPDGKQVAAGAEDIADGLRLTGYFLTHHVFPPGHGRMPAARERLVAGLG